MALIQGAPEWLLPVSGIEPFDEPGFQTGSPSLAITAINPARSFPAKAGK
jgi:hypothetical protein